MSHRKWRRRAANGYNHTEPITTRRSNTAPMKITLRRFSVTKRHALTISRGTSAGSENLLVRVEHDGIVGLGEMAPTSGRAVAESAVSAEADLGGWQPGSAAVAPWE